jgi:hypothetical protein
MKYLFWNFVSQPCAPAALYPPLRYLILIYVSGSLNPRPIVLLEVSGKLKKKKSIPWHRESKPRPFGLLRSASSNYARWCIHVYTYVFVMWFFAYFLKCHFYPSFLISKNWEDTYAVTLLSACPLPHHISLLGNCSVIRSRIHITTDSQSSSSSLCLALLGAGDQMLHLFEWQLLPLWREDGSVICSAMKQVLFQVTLRLTVCRPVRLGVGL